MLQLNQSSSIQSGAKGGAGRSCNNQLLIVVWDGFVNMILCSHQVDGRGVLAQMSPQTQQPTAKSVRGVFRQFIVELGGRNTFQIHNNQLKIVRLLDLQIVCVCAVFVLVLARPPLPCPITPSKPILCHPRHLPSSSMPRRRLIRPLTRLKWLESGINSIELMH